MKSSKKCVPYYRVSTDKQGASGLGLEAQEAAVRAWATANDARILQPYRETESGKSAKSNPELALALAACKRFGATLVIAKLDRLARNVAFIANLMESGVPFVACDQQYANPLTIHILAAVAEAEAKAISERTRVALAAAKARGTLLGAANPKCRNLANKPEASARGRVNAAAIHKRNRREWDEHYLPRICELREAGNGYTAIARALNDDGAESRRGFPWNDVQVRRVLLRSDNPPPPIYKRHRRRIAGI